MTELSFVDNQELRQQVIGRLDVLDKVKKLLLIPKVNVMTTAQVAKYYEVDIEAIQKVYQRNKDEIDEDGTVKLTNNFLSGHLVHVEKQSYATIYDIGDGERLAVTNAGLKSFSQRAILRIGMLLRDSPIAKEIRTQLLNVFETSTTGQKTQAIEDEEILFAAYGKAMILGDKQDMAEAARAIFDFQNRHINELKDNNKVLAGEILAWSDRAQLNKAIRVIANRINISHGHAWNMLYDELLYKHSISLKMRGKPPYIQHIKESEWKFVQQSLAAICEDNGLSPSKIMAKAKMSLQESVA